MPRRNDIKKILLIGSGPIIIGQACEFDYSERKHVKLFEKRDTRLFLLIQTQQRL